LHVEIVLVDVDGVAAVRLVHLSTELMNALVVGPISGGDRGNAGGRVAVPCGGVDEVGHRVAGGVVDQITDAGAEAAVFAGVIAERVQFLGP